MSVVINKKKGKQMVTARDENGVESRVEKELKAQVRKVGLHSYCNNMKNFTNSGWSLDENETDKDSLKLINKFKKKKSTAKAKAEAED